MTIYQQLLIFRTCLAVLVVMKKLVLSNNAIDRQKQTASNLQPLIKQVNDEVNRLLIEIDRAE